MDENLVSAELTAQQFRDRLIFGSDVTLPRQSEFSIEEQLGPEPKNDDPTEESSGSESENDDPLQRGQTVFDYRKVAIILSIYLVAGTVCFYLVRHQLSGKKTNGILDALYFTVVLLTSVGYGDLSPDTTLAILLAALFAFLGMLLIVLLLSRAAEFFVEKQEHLVESMLNKRQNNGNSEIKEVRTFNAMKHKFRMLVVFFVVLMAVGTAIMVSVEDLDLIHSFYCILATITSVGSDKCFSRKGGRVFALFWILCGTIYIGQLLFTLTELHTQRRQSALVQWIVKRDITISDLYAADLDNEGFIRKSGYLLYKLREMGKISEEDIAPFMERFRRLDVNNTGALRLSDIVHKHRASRNLHEDATADDIC